MVAALIVAINLELVRTGTDPRLIGLIDACAGVSMLAGGAFQMVGGATQAIGTVMQGGGGPKSVQLQALSSCGELEQVVRKRMRLHVVDATIPISYGYPIVIYLVVAGTTSVS